MKKYIEKEAAMQAIREFMEADTTSTEKAVGAVYCMEIVDKLPDVSVVHCKDCKNWKKVANMVHAEDDSPVYTCPLFDDWGDENGFCSYGVSKGDA